MPAINTFQVPDTTNIRNMLDNLQRAIEEATGVHDVIEGPGRTASRKAKNVQIGMEVDFPGYGWKVATGISKIGDLILISNGGNAFLPVDANDRIRTRRPA
jgi:hypothetical protein